MALHIRLRHLCFLIYFQDFLEKKGDYSFGRESSAEPDEDLVLSDPSSDEKDSDGSREDPPALGHYNSMLIILPLPLDILNIIHVYLFN